MNLRVLSYNIHKGIGWNATKVTINKIQSQIHQSGADIIFLQEVRNIQCELLRSEFCPNISYGENANSLNRNHGNVILSKFPIIFSENIDISMNRFERRGILHTIVEMNERPLHLLCTHLGLFSKDRQKQLDFIMQYINKNIPFDVPVILGGDFNDWRSHATNSLIKNLEFDEAFLNKHHSYAKTFPAWIPTLKLDRIYFRGFNVNYATRLTHKTWKYLSDHIGLEASLKLVV